jgi:hypothetical protein
MCNKIFVGSLSCFKVIAKSRNWRIPLIGSPKLLFPHIIICLAHLVAVSSMTRRSYYPTRISVNFLSQNLKVENSVRPQVKFMSN